MEIYVIIVSYNFERWIERNLDSLRKSTIPVHVVVVDNCSTDKTTELIKSNYPEVTLLMNQTNEGFGKANNIGIAFALKQHCDFVFLLNQDAWLDSNVIETLLEAFHKNPEFGILSPVHLNEKGNKLEHGFSLYTKIESKADLATLGDGVIKANIINAAFWMIPSKLIHLIGGFSPVFFHTGEDIDYINRLHYHGYEIGFIPTIFGYHDRENRNAKKEDLVFQLIEYSNINYSFCKAFGFGILAGFKKATEALIKEGIKEFVRLFLITIRLIFKSKKVFQFRRINKVSTMYYFN